MSIEALLGTDRPFAAEIQALRPHPGALSSAANIRRLLAGSPIVRSHRESSHLVQDAYSLRCHAQVAGAARDTLTFVQTILSCELRAAVDNQRMARGLGINVDGTFAVAFALGSGLAGLGGSLAIEIVGLDPSFALIYLVYVLIVVSVGGLGSIWGSFVAAVLSFLIITFVVQAFYIPTGSMEPTLQVGDRILVAKFAYRFRDVRRGDVIVFRYPLASSKDFVKRVVALAGETVELREGLVLIDGRPLSERYPTPLGGGDRACTSTYGPQRVPEGHLFVLGDNRCNSEDSRFFGFVPERNVIGRALVIYWPPDRVGLIH